jgi:hypothetical protein
LNWQTHDRQFKSKRLVSLITHDDDDDNDGDDDDDMGMMKGYTKTKGQPCLWTRLIECGIELNDCEPVGFDDGMSIIFNMQKVYHMNVMKKLWTWGRIMGCY